MKRLMAASLSLLLCAALLTTYVCLVFASEGNEILSPKKIISVVYDDSGSMASDNRYVYTNYAMQGLTALLNERDELFITSMTDESNAHRYSLQDIPAAVKKIKNGFRPSGGTPVKSIETALAALENSKDTDISTQYWLVVTTDGLFDELNQFDPSDLQNKMDALKGKTMPNNSVLNVIYLGMGNAMSIQEDPAQHLYARFASDEQQITDALVDVANLISGRLLFNNVKQKDDKTITFSSKIPLYSISILLQKSNATIVSAQMDEGALTVSRNIGLQSSDGASLELKGNAGVINKVSSGQTTYIPAGTYTVTFSEKVSVQNIVAQYEPAIGIKTVVTKDGKAVTDLKTLEEDDKIDVRVIPVIPGTDQEIPESDIPKTVKWSLSYFVDDNETASADKSLSGVEVKLGKNVIRAAMQIEGFAPVVQETPFDVAEAIYHLDLDLNQPDNLEYLRRKLSAGSVSGEEMQFTITNDGQPLPPDKIKKLNCKPVVLNVSCDDTDVHGFWDRFGKIPVDFRFKQLKDGSYVLKPKGGFPLTPFLLKAGQYTVEIGLENDDSVQATGSFRITPSIWDWLYLFLLLLFVIVVGYLVFILFVKKKFSGQTIHCDVYSFSQATNQGVLRAGASSSVTLQFYQGHLFSLKRACYIDRWGLRFEAAANGSINITPESIAKGVSAYVTMPADPTKNFQGIRSNMRTVTPQRVPAQQTLSKVNANNPIKRAFYFAKNKDGRVYCIWIG